jgi:hypothetical protein
MAVVRAFSQALSRATQRSAEVASRALRLPGFLSIGFKYPATAVATVPAGRRRTFHQRPPPQAQPAPQ